MNVRQIKKIIEIASKKKTVALVGLGTMGRELYNMLDISSIIISYAFDNSERLKGKFFHGIAIQSPYKVEECLYIVAIAERVRRREVVQQLVELGIRVEDIEVYSGVRDFEYMEELEPENYVEEMKDMFFETFGYDLSIDNPKTFNEKICVDKVCNRNPQKVLLADKYKVKKWVKDKIGDKHVVKMYGVWDDAYDIDFELLPKSFVLKVNNASGHNIVVKNKEEINKEAVCRQLNEWMQEKFGFVNLELHYNDIEPKIICDEYLEGLAEEVYDYNIYCFHGKPKYIWCIKGSHKTDCSAAFYDTEWNKLPFTYGYPMDDEIAPKPVQLQEMLKLSEKLSSEFNHVRVDWYNLPDGRVLFGEMTFTSWGGNLKFDPEEYDLMLGELI